MQYAMMVNAIIVNIINNMVVIVKNNITGFFRSAKLVMLEPTRKK